MQTTTAALKRNAIVSHQLEHNNKEKDDENGDNTSNSNGSCEDDAIAID
jgi:hypothetical protein